MKIICIFSAFFFLGSISSQTLPEGINGSVQSADGSSLNGVRVILHHNNLQQYTETNPTGQYHFECRALNLDINASYFFSYYKPGYEFKREFRLLNDAKPIILAKRAVGYLQLREINSLNFLAGYQVAIQDGAPVVSDNFGYVTIPIPPDFTEDQEIRISVEGNFRYQNKVLTVTKSSLRNKIIDVILSPSLLKYPDLKKSLEDMHEKQSKDGSIESAKGFINVYDRINELQLSPKEKQDWALTKGRLSNSYDYLQRIAFHELSNDTIQRKRYFDTFHQEVDQTLQLDNGKKVFMQYDNLFNLGMQILELDISIYKTTSDIRLFLGDVDFLQKFLEGEKGMLERYKNQMGVQYFGERRNKLQQKANQLLKKAQF